LEHVMPRKSGTKTNGRGEAGRKGEDVRSDLYVSLEIKQSGGLDVELDSKVATAYGNAIRETVQDVLTKLGVEHAHVDIVDQGALPFVVAARIEAAARRAGAGGEAARPEAVAANRVPTERNRLRRSRLYLPGNEPKFMINAGLHRPDGVILDLEDSVHPTEKDAARLVVRNALGCVDFLGAERMVRINQLPLGLEDLDEVIPEAPNVVLIPKVERAEQVREVDERIRGIRRNNKQSEDPIWLMPILESALGVEHAYAIASASDAVVAITIGLEDYTADLGVQKTTEGSESLFARGRIVNAARAAGVQASDSVYGDVGDIEGLRAWGVRSRAMGFEGMGCLHPRQIQPIHEAFAPTQAEIDKALKIVAAFEEAEARGLGVVSLGTRMVDPPVVLRAQRLVEVARKAGLLDAAPGDSAS
jgi:citrate lyase subunit beta/citryl-CoA lyase